MWEIYEFKTFEDLNGIIFLGIILSIISFIGFEALKRFLKELF